MPKHSTWYRCCVDVNRLEYIRRRYLRVVIKGAVRSESDCSCRSWVVPQIIGKKRKRKNVRGPVVVDAKPLSLSCSLLLLSNICFREDVRIHQCLLNTLSCRLSPWLITISFPSLAWYSSSRPNTSRCCLCAVHTDADRPITHRTACHPSDLCDLDHEHIVAGLKASN